MHEIRNAFRALKAAPVVSGVAILSLALGIGANTAMFSILDSLLLRSLPVRDPARLAMIGDTDSARTTWSNPIWEQIRNRPELFDGALAWSSTRFNLSQAGQTEYVDGVWTSARYFEVLGVPAVLGRTWLPSDDARGGGPDGPAAIISYDFWQRRFNGAADAIGRTLTVERVPFTIVGVTPPGFFGLDVGRTFDVAIPIGTEPLIRGKESALDRRSNWWLRLMVRVEPDQSIARSIASGTAALRAIQPQIRAATVPLDWREDEKKNYLRDAFILDPAATGNSSLRTRYQRPLTTIMVVVALVLLIACANIANLLLARATARRHELSVRLALGASRGRLARQLITESLLLSGLGAVLGLAFAAWGSRLLVQQLSTSTSTVMLPLALDWRVLGFTAAVAIATAALFGTVPALRSTRVQPHDAIKEQGRGTAGHTRFTVGNVLVVVQVALSLMLVVAAGLFVRTFASLSSVDLGFDRDPVLVATLNLQPLKLESDARWQLIDDLQRAAAGVPGVANAAVSSVTPLGGGIWNNRVAAIDGAPVEGAANARYTYVNMVSPEWFTTYGTRVLGGRAFTAADARGSHDVAIVNQAFARRFTGGRNPLGSRVSFQARATGRHPEIEIVGVVADAAYDSLREPPPPTMYLPFRREEQAPSFTAISVRAATGAPGLLTRPLATAMTQVHGNVAITFRPVSDQVSAALTQERLVAWLSAFFGGLALLLAALGLYGVTSYAVSRRRAEIGIRMALGAAPGGVVAMVLIRVGLLVAGGIAIGAGLSLWASTFVSTLLYGLPPRDPLTLTAAAVILATIGIAAGAVPALRASRIDPAKVLRLG